MAYEVLMPKLSSTMTEGTITLWLKKEGDPVEVGEAIFEVMTDKIAIEVEAYEEGILLKRYIDVDESAPVNSIIAYIGNEGEAVPEQQPIHSIAEEKSSSTNSIKNVSVVSVTNIEAKKSDLPNNIRATPAARKAAREREIDLAQVSGTGPKGRIQLNDVTSLDQVVVSKTAKESMKTLTETGLIPWQGMRKVIAENMLCSYTTIPHVNMTAEVTMIKLVTLRKQLLSEVETQTEERLSYVELIIRAVTIALKQYPMFNAHALPEGIQLFETANIGVAVALADGLVVPVVKDAARMGLSELTQSVKELTRKARSDELCPDDMSGGTFTISSLGKSKVRSFTPIINAPEVAILGVGGVFDTLSTDSYNGIEKIEVIPKLTLCLSFDHRIVDGAPAAAFLSMIVELLEEPMKLLL